MQKKKNRFKTVPLKKKKKKLLSTERKCFKVDLVSD